MGFHTLLNLIIAYLLALGVVVVVVGGLDEDRSDAGRFKIRVHGLGLSLVLGGAEVVSFVAVNTIDFSWETGGKKMEEIPTPAILHHNVQIRFVLINIVKLNHVGMVEELHNGDLTTKEIKVVLKVMFVDDLHRIGFLRGCDWTALVNFAIRATANDRPK